MYRSRPTTRRNCRPRRRREMSVRLHSIENDGDDDIRADAWDAMYRRHPMSRDGDPEDDIAPVVLFLCSDACRFLNGETLMIDGGGYMTA